MMAHRSSASFCRFIPAACHPLKRIEAAMIRSRSCLNVGLVITAFVFILGAFSLSITEGLISSVAAPGFWQTPDLNIAWLVSPTATATITSTPTPCPLPQGWVTYQIQPGDSAELLSINRGFTLDMIQLANCQSGQSFTTGQVIFLPAHTITPTRTYTPTQTNTPIVCSHPQGWSPYVVQAGDTSFSLSLKYNIGVIELQKANCLEENEDLKPGMEVYLPLPATMTPIPPTPVNSATLPPPTVTPTVTPLILFTAPPV
ncbi:MAG: LysM peptidoglycan-binding domain-containing protein [Anaerolineaceae bacterium]